MAACAILCVCALLVGQPVYHAGTTTKVMQVTGDYDATLSRETLSQTLSEAGVAATDLGSSFEHKGKLYFLFGDTRGQPGKPTQDSIAYSEATTPEKLRVHFLKGADGLFRPIEIPGISQGGMEVPTHGISINGNLYIVHTTDWFKKTGNMERSVVARSADDGHTWTYLYDLSKAKSHDMADAHFVNAYLTEVDAEDYPGQLPYASGKVVLIWGSGAYRKSSPRLACIPSEQIEKREVLRYFAGLDQEEVPRWSNSESAGAALFHHDRLGEFSVAWVEPTKCWVMLYNTPAPRGIMMRTALNPWGPYSEGQIILDPWKDKAYGTYMHVSWRYKNQDTFHDSGRELVWGGEYAPYIISRFTTGDSARCLIYYTMSTWNPYQVILVRSEIGAPQPQEITDEGDTK